MNIENEIRLLEVNKIKLIKAIEDLGGVKKGNFDFKRYVYDFTPVDRNKWIRLRTDGKESTLTIKEIVDETVDGTKEWETTVGNFEITNQILNQLGFNARNYQENRREMYILNNCEICIDDWPMIPTYAEIEGKSVAEVMEVAKILKPYAKEITSMGVAEIYKHYGIDIKKIKHLNFEIKKSKLVDTIESETVDIKK